MLLSRNDIIHRSGPVPLTLSTDFQTHGACKTSVGHPMVLSGGSGERTSYLLAGSARNSDLLSRCIKPRARNWCGKDHPVWEPKFDVVVDDIAALAPAGELVALETGTRQGTILVETADRNRDLSDFAPLAELASQPESPGQPCGYRPNLAASGDSVLGRLLGAGLSEAHIVDHLAHGRIRVEGRVAHNLHDPAIPPTRIVLIP